MLGADAGALVEAINVKRRAAGRLPLIREARLESRLEQWLTTLSSEGPVQGPPGILDDRGWPYAQTRFAFIGGRGAERAIERLAGLPTGADLLLDPQLTQVAVASRPFDKAKPELGADFVLVGLRRLAAPAVRAGVRVDRKTLLVKLLQSRHPLAQGLVFIVLGMVVAAALIGLPLLS